MYTYKYPDKKVPKGGDACFVKGLHKEIWGYDPYNVEPIESYCEKAIHIE